MYWGTLATCCTRIDRQVVEGSLVYWRGRYGEYSFSSSTPGTESVRVCQAWSGMWLGNRNKLIGTSGSSSLSQQHWTKNFSSQIKIWKIQFPFRVASCGSGSNLLSEKIFFYKLQLIWLQRCVAVVQWTVWPWGSMGILVSYFGNFRNS